MSEKDTNITSTIESPIQGFLASAVPDEVGRAVRQGVKSGNGFCYRHNPRNSQCRSRAANEPLMSDIQNALNSLRASDKEKEGITHIWSFFSAANPQQRQLILQGLLAQCCFPQLSYIASCTRDLIRIDYISALPAEIGFKILSYLDASSLCKAAQVSTRWAQLANDDVVWHRMCEQHIDRKCVKCGWGLPLLERKRLRASRQAIQRRAEALAAKYNVDSVIEEARPSTSASDMSEDTRKRKIGAILSRPAGVEMARKKSTTDVLAQCFSSTNDSNTPPTLRPWKEVYCERQKIESNWRRGRFESRILQGHTDGVMCVQADETIIASGSYDKTIRLWSLTTGEEIKRLEGHTRGVNALQFDDIKLISGSMDKTLRIWNYRTGECLSVLRGHAEGVLSLHFDDTLLVSGGADSTVRVWNFADGRCRILRGHDGWINSVRVHSACQVAFSASDDTTMKMWNLQDNTCIRTFTGHVGQIQSISPALPPVSEEDPYNTRSQKCPKEYFTSSLDGTVKWWDVKSGNCIKTFFGHVEGVWALVADTLRLVTGAQDKTVKVWDRNEGRCVLSLTGHSGPVNCISLGDSRIISGGDDGQLRIWDFSSQGLSQQQASLQLSSARITTAGSASDTAILSDDDDHDHPRFLTLTHSHQHSHENEGATHAHTHMHTHVYGVDHDVHQQPLASAGSDTSIGASSAPEETS
ncbi:hypothetical protein PYCC9005_000424 [Savitreella phatthalungensis]